MLRYDVVAAMLYGDAIREYGQYWIERYAGIIVTNIVVEDASIAGTLYATHGVAIRQYGG